MHISSRLKRALGFGIGVGIVAGLAGCARMAEQPEANPDRWAPQSAERAWTPSPASASDYRVPSDNRPPPPATTAAPAQPSGQKPAHEQGEPYDLPALLDLALRENPDTRFAWESARQAAANFGAARAPYYPLVSANSANGYTRTLFPLPGGIAAQYKVWQAQPLVQTTYTLLDFGRRSSSATAARQALAAANFSFDRKMQDVVFAVQRAYYSLCASKAAVVAARQNLELARSDFDAVQQRVNLGLATEPALLLAKERVSQSQYDVANAELLVHDAEAALAAAIGIPADQPIEVASLEALPVPTRLGGQIEDLIAATIRQRPDLAAKVAGLRASEARVALAKAAWYPTVDLTANYGQLIWRFTFLGPPTAWANQPQYSALVTLQWDVFTGFKRLNDVRASEAEDAAARAGVRSAEISAIAEMWRAYYEFQSSLKKYSYGQALVAAAQEAYDANLETYRQGLSTIVELLTAQRDLAGARYTLIQSRADLLTSYAAVTYAAGAIETR
ncbi:MAG TPA: TolC family protein [Candidatus Binataceae bacterium]